MITNINSEGLDDNYLNLILNRSTRGVGDLAMALRAIELTRLKYPTCNISLISNYPDLLNNHPAIDNLYKVNRTQKLDSSGVFVDLTIKHDYSKTKHEMFCNAISNELMKYGYQGFTWDGKPQRLWVTRELKQWAIEFVNRYSSGKIPIGIFWRSEQSFKNWYNMVDLVNLLLDSNKFSVFCFDKSLVFPGNKQAVNIVGYSLDKVVAIISCLELLISPDTSGVHLAGGVDTPVLGIFGPTDPTKLIGMYKDSQWLDIDCKYHPCWFSKKCFDQKCLKNITAPMVFDKVRTIFPNAVEYKRGIPLFWGLPNKLPNPEQKRHLIARFIGLGDVGMLMFALEEYREKFKNDHITFLTSPGSAALFNGHKDIVDRIVYTNFRHHAEDRPVKLPIDTKLFDIVHNLVNKVDFGDIAHTKNRVDNFANLLGVEVDPDRPVRFLKIAEFERDWFLTKVLADRYYDKIIACQLDSNGIARRWPYKYWQDLAWLVYKEYGSEVLVVFLSARQHPRMYLPPNVIDLSCQTNIRQFITSIALSDLLVCCDTSGLHIGGRCEDVRVLLLCGSTGIADDGKHAHANYYSGVDIVESSLSCSPCWDFQLNNCSNKVNFPVCMHRMKPKKVFNRVREMLYESD